jgi:hypothetical protein
MCASNMHSLIMKLFVNYSKKKKENVGGNEIRIHALIDTTICQIAIIWIKNEANDVFKHFD